MHHLCATHEIAAMLGVSRQRVAQLAAHRDFPRPVAVVAGGRVPVWRVRDIERWAMDSGRVAESR